MTPTLAAGSGMPLSSKTTPDTSVFCAQVLMEKPKQKANNKSLSFSIVILVNWLNSIDEITANEMLTNGQVIHKHG